MTAPAFILPRLMQTPVAATYLGISASKLRGLPIPRKVDGGNVLYDRLDLDEYASSLPYENKNEGGNSCDEAFG